MGPTLPRRPTRSLAPPRSVMQRCSPWRPRSSSSASRGCARASSSTGASQCSLLPAGPSRSSTALISCDKGGTEGRVPSLFNGHLLDYLPFLLGTFGPIAYLDLKSKGFDFKSPKGFDFKKKGELNGGDYDFDPMGLTGPQKPAGAVPFDAFMTSKPIGYVGNMKDMEDMKEAEIKNGRLAMMGITGMAVQECLYGTPVVDQTPFFFGR